MEKQSFLWRMVFVSTGEYIKLVEREKEARCERCAHWEAETDLRALGKLRNQRRVDNLYIKTTVGKVCMKVIEWVLLSGPFMGGKMDYRWATENNTDIRHSAVYSP